MTQARNLRGTTPNTRPAPTKTAAEIQDAKRFEKAQAHASSHRTAGSLETPQPGDGVLQQLQYERGHG